jgi:16S rRNA (guanine(966)-N(2))-methyltransferase RsmD
MSNPRIIAGKARGLRIKPVPGDSTRPITDRVKEALFNIIGPDIEDALVLDLFGGTGSVGIEALSRGARFVQFIDNNHHAVDTIKSNLQTTNLKDKAKVHLADAFSFIKKGSSIEFDYIYIAPPQYKNLWQKAILEVDSQPGFLKDDSWVIVQIHPVEYEKMELAHLQEFEQRKYGSTLLIFYEVRENS